MEGGKPTTTDRPRRLARLGYTLIAAWVIAIVGLFVFIVLYSRLPVSGWDVLVVVVVAVIVPLVGFVFWRVLVLTVSGGGR
jgi:uncharacterized oligopeptide transporter (OPT) family protein